MSKIPEGVKPCCRTALESDRGSCIFGCGSHVDADMKMCGRCRDHSANRVECPECGTAFEDWTGTWEETK